MCLGLAYQQAGLTLSSNASNDAALVKALQRDLRCLGYLRSSIDGAFGRGTDAAIRALRYDLLNNVGASRQDDGSSSIAMTDYNRGRVTAVNGVLDQDLAACIADLLADEQVAKLPNAIDPNAENKRGLAAIVAAGSAIAPMPFLVAIMKQESNAQHFHVPRGGDEDSFVTVGLDHAGGGDAITSRGYGTGQYTIFHHPPRPEEVQDFILDPVRNVTKAYLELKEKFDRFVSGPDSRAKDRDVEHPLLPLRKCRYASSDPLYMRDCAKCAAATRKLNITKGTPVYSGATTSYQPDQYYPSATYTGVPDRAEFLCDWPYAARRYNGEGNDSYHYQARILVNLLSGATLP